MDRIKGGGGEAFEEPLGGVVIFLRSLDDPYVY
jgi:hypothetical protein